MNLIELNKYKSKIELSIDDLKILKNSLFEVNRQFSDNDFLSLIQYISKKDSTEYLNSLEEILDHCENKSRLSLILTNKISNLIQITDNGVLIELSYEILWGFNGILNIIISEVCLHFQDFNLQIGYDRTEVQFLLSSWFKIVYKMREQTIGYILFIKARDISNNLGINYYSLPDNLVMPQIRKECQLNLQSHVILLLLFSQNKARRIYSGIKIIIGKPLKPIIFYAKSHVGITRHDDLINLIAYLEYTITSLIDDIDLKDCILSLRYPGTDLFTIQLLSRFIESDEVKSINIRVRLYSPIQENSPDTEYLEIEDTLSISNIHSFISSVKEFLCEQSIAHKSAFEALSGV